MENIILQKTRYLKALMLTMLVGFFAFGASAQTWDATTVPPSPQYANQEATVTYEASGFPAGTTFILWDDAINNNQIDPDEIIFGTATVQGAATDIDFVWPADDVRLKLGGFSGDVVEGEIINVQNIDVTVVGTNSTDFAYVFNRSSARSLTTTTYDLDTTDPVVLSISINDFGLDVDNPLEVLYSTDNFATAGTVLTEDGSGLDEFDFGGTLNFTLPAGAKNPSTSFRIRQKGTIDYGTAKRWDVNFADIEIGETYALEAPGLGVNQLTTILTPQLTINDILNTNNVSFGNIYPGDDVTVQAELQNADFTGLDFAVTVTNSSGQSYLLENQNVTADNGTKLITVVGDVPTDIIYDNFNQWDIDIYAYEGAEILFGVSEFYDFTAGLPADVEQVGGFQDGTGLTFNEAGERTLTTVPYNITSTDGVLTFNAARANNVLSPDGTDIIVEYSTDGEIYTELASIPLNSLSTAGTEIVFDTWPAGVVSNSTQFRFRQEGNNGTDLDTFVIQDLDIQNSTSIVSEALIGRGGATDQVNIYSPFITLDNINIGGDGQAFPMENYTLTYTIDDGTFPANTPATAYLQRTGQPDIIIGETVNVNGLSIDFTVPPIEAGDYNIYFRTLNDQQYGSVNLAIYDLGLEITSVEYTDPVLVGADEFTYAGSGLTANYTIQGTPGTGAELMMSVYDNNPDVNDWVMIGSTTILDGSITATLPLGIDYDNNPNVQLSLGSGGVYSSAFSETVLNDFWYGNSIPTEIVESTQGTGDTFITDGFEGSGVRSVTSVPLDFSYGGNLSLNLYTQANFISDFTVRLEGSTDGQNWEEIDEITFTFLNDVENLNSSIPNELWSETFQFRIIYNEDEAFGFGENLTTWYSANITKPTFLEVVQDVAPFNLIKPSLAVSDYDKTAFAMGEEVSINYNAIGFPAATDYAAVIEQNGEYVVVGTASAEGAGTITATMPIGFGNEIDPYDLTIVPYEGAEYKQGETIDVDQEEDFLIISGQDPAFDNNYNVFDFDRSGNRELLTRAFDLSGVSSATLNFNFNTFYGYGSFDLMDNKNTVPRLEISTDGGATFQVIEVYELEVGETQIYDDGLLYLAQGYNVELPASALTGATHFRWSQPLNLGQGSDRWVVDNISVTLNDDNRVPDFIFTDNVNGNNPITINITAPSLNGYAWMQANLDDAVFNGETFNYSWDIAEGFNAGDVDAFPAGTEFIFSLNNFTDPETGEDVIIANTASLGSFEGSVPLFVGSGNYTVNLTAVLEIDEEEIFLYEDQAIGNLDVFNQVLQTTFNGDANAVYYAGNQVTVDYAFENDLSSTTNTAIGDLFYNLVLNFDGDDWLLAVDESLTGSFTVDMPPFVNENYGAVDFEVVASVGGPLGVVGETLENSGIGFLNDTDDWINDDVALDYGLPGNGGGSQLSDVSGRRVLTSADFDLVEANAVRLSFDLQFTDNGGAIDPADVLENQRLIFEYSTDGGATYTSLENFPSENDVDPLSTNYETKNYLLDNVAITESTRFRFRQEESRFRVRIRNMQIIAADEAQIENVSAANNGFVPSIKPQSIQITSVGATEACLSDNITLNYEIRGKFGADNEVTVQYTGDNDIAGVYNLIEGSGSIDISVPTVLNAGDNNQDFKFRLQAEDRTFDDLGYPTNVNGTYTETNVEVVAPIDIDQDFTIDNQQLCDVQDIMVNIVGPQNYFTYQVINAISGDAIGDPLTYDPELGDTEINLGELTDEVRLGLQVTSASSTGTICNTITSTVEQDLNVQPNYALFSSSGNAATLVAPETTVDLCGTTLTLSASYYDSNGNQQDANAAEVEWFRDNLQTPVGSNATLSTFNRSGDYFARITDGNCIYTTEMITVNVSVRPDQPAITVASGDLVSCDENNEVLLEGPEGFATYVWDLDGTTLNANQRTITVSTAGTYQLQVSNASEANNCNLSNSSEPVILNTVSDDDVFIDIIGFGQAQAGQVYDICDNNGTTINVTGAVGANANIRWFQDGAEYAANTNTDGSININVSGAYYAEVTAGQCTFTTPEVTFNVLEAPQDAPTITATGDLTFCDGQGSVVLEGPEGFGYYEWYRNGGAIGSGAVTNNNTLEVTQSGTYTLEVGNVSGDGAVPCLSPTSNTITVNTRTLPDVPRALVFDNSCGDGPVTFVLDDAFFSGVYNQVQSNVSYQLINASTDEPSGLAVTGNGNSTTYITSDVITEETTFYIEATYADGSGCTVSYPETRAFTATPNNVTLEVEGAQLIASYNGNAIVRWYRDGVLLTNETSNRITISDAAEYSVEVEYASGCVVTASSADIAGKVLGNQDAMAMKVVSYPNPTLSDVTLNVNSQYMGKHEVIITSMTGQVMMQSSFEKSSFEAEHAMNVANLEEGIYNVQIRHDGLTQNVRIIKK